MGVRGGVGGFEPVTGSSPSTGGFLVTWLLFRTEGLGGYVQLNRDAFGNEMFLDGRLRHDDGREDRIVRAVELDLEFPARSRWYRRASMRVTDDQGSTYDIECERLSLPIVMRGAGYDNGFDDGAGLGAHRGAEHVEIDAYDLANDGAPRLLPDLGPVRAMQTEQPVSLVVNGRPGVGDLTVVAVGDLSHYGVPAVEDVLA